MVFLKASDFFTYIRERIKPSISNGNKQPPIVEIIVVDLLRNVFAAGISIGIIYVALSFLNNKSSSKAARRALASKLNRPEIEKMTFSSHESNLFLDVISPTEIDVTFDNIGGIDDKLQDVKDNIILPLEMWHVLKGQSQLMPCPTGMLLYGKPGTGKTLTAKAIAKESGATFINVKSSALLDKWLGETDKRVSALFSLARKLAPTVIFIDEIDTLLGSRDDGRSTGKNLDNMQGLFLQEWDGLTSSEASASGLFDPPVIVLGATNRPNSIDKAFLRRMPFVLEIPLPSTESRKDILKKLLEKETVEESVDFDKIAAATVNFSGSDLKELVRLASMQRVKAMAKSAREYLGTKARGSMGALAAPNMTLRPLSALDFDYALNKNKSSASMVKTYDMNSASSNAVRKFDFLNTIINKMIESKSEEAESESDAGDESDKSNSASTV